MLGTFDDSTNKGINIGGAAGDPVKALRMGASFMPEMGCVVTAISLSSSMMQLI